MVKEQFRLLANQIPLCYSVIMVNSAVMSILASDKVDRILAFLFLVVAIPVMVGRIFTWRRRSKIFMLSNDIAAMRLALRGTVIAANIMAIGLAVWSVMVMFALPHSEIATVPPFTILSMITCAY